MNHSIRLKTITLYTTHEVDPDASTHLKVITPNFLMDFKQAFGKFISLHSAIRKMMLMLYACTIILQLGLVTGLHSLLLTSDN